ncbi:MAG: RcnB family protein [Rhodospirillales bacterium]|nr:RcnB family protein [Rhodospirillales bacterium]MDH3917860.1 RcnB family protein [Rhodospirillales bacterium]MDH3968353.1 RcnB family protein [Rhodospirillales bacterium]
MTLLTRAAAVLLSCFALTLAAPAFSGEVSGKLITAAEKEIIRHYFGGSTGSSQTRPSGGKQDKAKDKGKSKGKGAGQMPQGIAMKLQRGGTLPPGIARRDLPSPLIRELPRRPAGQELQVIDDNVVLIEKTTGLILDILEHAAR